MKKKIRILLLLRYDEAVSKNYLKLLSQMSFLKRFSLVVTVCVLSSAYSGKIYAQDNQFRVPKPHEAVSLLSHKAIYDISLNKIKRASKVIDVEGQMLYTLQKTCEGYLANHQFNLLYEYTDFPGLRVTSDFSNLESLDGRNLKFFSARETDGELTDQYSGVADLNEAGEGKAVITDPEEQKFILPKNTYFPNQHTAAIIKAAQKGQKIFNATLFDGSDEQGPMIVNAFILSEKKPLPAKEQRVSLDQSLGQSGALNTKSWKVRLAFFPLESELEEPEYEMTVRLHENGVISEMFVEYTDFSVIQKLTALETLETQETCGVQIK